MLATQQIFLIASLLCFLVFLALLSASADGARGMRAMLWATLLGVLGNLLYAFGRELPPLLAYEAANMVYAGAGAALASGYRQLAARPDATAPLALAVAAVGGLIALFHDVLDSFAARSAVASLFQAGICIDIGRSILAGSARRRLNQVQRFVLSMCALVTLGHAVRMGWLLLAAEPPGSLLQPSIASVTILTAGALAFPALALGGLLNMHRHLVLRAEYVANHDHLTGAWSRRAFFEIAARELARSARTGRPLALMLIDLDHFKTINDECGHEAGDTALRLVAEHALGSLRAVDCVARLGGDEFAVLLPETGLGQAVGVGDKLRQALHAAAAATLPAAATAAEPDPTESETQERPGLTLSIGVTVALEGEEFKATLARADMALYAAKRAGRNRVHALAPEPQLVQARRTG